MHASYFYKKFIEKCYSYTTENKVFSRIFQCIFKQLMDDNDRTKLKRMKDCGVLKLTNKSRQEIESTGDMYIAMR